MSFQEAHGQALLGKDLGIAHFSLGPDKRGNRKSGLCPKQTSQSGCGFARRHPTALRLAKAVGWSSAGI
jgi:hypothetical protein